MCFQSIDLIGDVITKYLSDSILFLYHDMIKIGIYYPAIHRAQKYTFQ